MVYIFLMVKIIEDRCQFCLETKKPSYYMMIVILSCTLVKCPYFAWFVPHCISFDRLCCMPNVGSMRVIFFWWLDCRRCSSCSCSCSCCCCCCCCCRGRRGRRGRHGRRGRRGRRGNVRYFNILQLFLRVSHRFSVSPSFLRLTLW